MGFRKPMDYNSISHQIYMAGIELHSNYNDGWNQWAIKQDLYKLKWLLDEIMVNSPTFSDEGNFLKEHDKTKMWKSLNEVQHLSPRNSK